MKILLTGLLMLGSMSSFANLTIEGVCNELNPYPRVCQAVSYCEFVEEAGYCEWDGVNQAGRYLSQSGVISNDKEKCMQYRSLGFRWKNGGSKCLPF